jgi:putative phosphoesterase
MKIGVLADTHIPDRRRSLPARVIELFEPVEIVLHAGDVTSMQVLQTLQDRVSLTFAVCGDQDPPIVREYLQETHVLEFAGCRIGLVHGHRDSRTEMFGRIRRIFKPDPYTPEYLDYLLGRFNGVDAIVFGHTHVPYARVHKGVYLFNPGAITPSSGTPTAGLLEINTRGIRGRILPL